MCWWEKALLEFGKSNPNEFAPLVEWRRLLTRVGRPVRALMLKGIAKTVAATSSRVRHHTTETVIGTSLARARACVCVCVCMFLCGVCAVCEKHAFELIDMSVNEECLPDQNTTNEHFEQLLFLRV